MSSLTKVKTIWLSAQTFLLKSHLQRVQILVVLVLVVLATVFITNLSPETIYVKTIDGKLKGKAGFLMQKY